MKRTYRSKKYTGGALDHRNVLLNMDEKSSVFDAFYIQNIKQTKREISCVGSSNGNGDASKKVRKKKYVKRIVKEVENMQPRESMPTQSTSTYLTPDKSIRVNKILDAFDMLLNSSSTGQVQAGDINNDVLYKVPPKKEDKKYTRKKLTRVKKLNYSSEHSSDSDKENTSNSQQNMTDIRTHELHVERVLCKNPKKFDESINKIVNNLSLMNNFKGKTEKSSFNTSYKHHRNKYIVNNNCQSPILQKSTIYQNSPILQRSPFCSTPFKDKYRGKSIYNFSPISTKERVSLNYETIKEENNEINKSSGQIPKLSKEQTSPPNNISDSDSRTTSKSLIYEDEIDPLTDLCVTEKKVENEPEPITKRQIAIAEQSLFQLTEAEPFLGFSHNSVIEKITDRIQENNSDSDSNLTEGDSQNDRDQCLTKLSENGNFNKYDDDKSYRDTSLENHSEDISLNDSKARNSTQDSDKESMYDTCNSEESVSEDNINEISINNRVPKVAIERMSDSVFLKFYEKMLINKEDSLYRDASMTDEVQSDIDDDQSNVDETKSQDENEDKIDSDENQSYVDESQSQDEDEESDIHDMMNDVDETESQDENGGKIDIDENDSSVDESQSQDENGGKIDIDENDSSVDESQSQDENLSTDYENQSKVDEMQIEVDKILNEENDDEFDNKSMDDYSASFYKFSNDNISNTSKNTEYYPGETQTNEITISDSSTTEDVESSDETSTHEDEKCVSFVTTRRRNEITNDSLFIFNNSYCSSSTDCNNTILSNKARLSYLVEKSDLELDMSLHQPRTSDFNEIDACVENIEDEDRTDRISRTMTKKCLRLPRQSAVDNTVMDSSIRIDEIKAVEFSKALSTKQPGTSEHRRSSITTKKSSRMLRDSMVSESSKIYSEVKPSIVLQPGKKWERSMSIYRRMTTMADHFDQSLLDDEGLKKGRKYRQSVISTMGMQDSLHNESINSRRSTFVSKPSRPTIRFVKDSNNSRISLNTTEVFDDLKGFLTEECDDTVIELSKLSLADSEFEVTVLDNFHETSGRVATARDYVLRRCNQTDPILFDECYPETVLKNCHKIGEGVYGEVFLWRGRDGRARVMKIVPIAGSIKVNGETQKDFHEVISEIVIAMELSALRAPIADIDNYFDEGKDVETLDLHSVENATDVFNEVLAVRCVQGPYPSRLLDLWDLYDECKGSENDNPAVLPCDQQYIVLELANAGQDLESYQFTGAQQAHALFQQIAFGLAVGEESFQFEHRDLHWGNVLIAPTEQKFATFVLRGRTYRVPRGGVAATIIDYSLSRISLPLSADRAALYNDLGTDEQLFDAVGDYQFQVYRLMRDKLGNDWKSFEPYTNILWLHYTVDKMITALRYKRTTTKIHKHYIDKLKGIKERLLDYKSATEYVLTDIEI